MIYSIAFVIASIQSQREWQAAPYLLILPSLLCLSSPSIPLPSHPPVAIMAAQTIEDYKVGAQIYHGDALCKKQSIQLLEELGLPKGLLPLEDIEEFGYNRAGGFMWLIQKKKKEHTFKKIKQHVSYATEVIAFVEERKLKKITGVKTKELLLWLSVVEVFIDNPSSEKITFKTGTGLSDSFPVSAFELEE